MGNGICAPRDAPVGPMNDVDKQLELAKEEEKYNIKILLLGKVNILQLSCMPNIRVYFLSIPI